MAWWIVYAAILGLGGVALVYAFQQIRQRRDELNGSLLMDVPLCRHEMEAHIKHIASRRLEGRRQLLRTRSGFQRRLAKLTKLLGAIDEKDLLPGLKWIRENARVLEEDWLSLKEILRSAPSLPADGKGEIFITRFSREIVSHTNAVFTGETLIRSLMSWQAVAPFTLRERWMIPLALRYTLMNFILSRGWQLWSVQRQRAQGLKMASELSGRKSNSAQKRLAASSGGAAFWEAVITGLRKSDNPSANAFLAEHLARLELDGERLVSQELHRQAVDQMWLGNAITSLKRIDRVDWDLMLEALDPVDALLRQDSVYASMDQESRGFYRSRVQRLAALSGQEEIRLAGAICSLAQTGEADGVHNHTGYYLLEDAGLKALGAYLKIHSLRWRIYLFSRHRSAALYRSVLFAGVIAGVFLCFWLNLPLWLFFPTGILFSQGTRWLLRRAISRFVPVRMLPRLNVSPLAPDKQTLVVCPTLLTTPKQAMAMVRQLAILHHASPDPRLHFMLLGDFGDSMTREQTADQAIVASAKAGIEALNETLPTQFFYLQRERFYDPKQRSYISRERKRGSLESLNRLLAGQAPKDAYTYASCDMQQLAGKYAYVITLDSDTFLPPGAAFRLIGAISHPLQMRRKLGGEMRGVSVVAPRMQVLATSVHSRLSSLWGGRGGIDPYNASQSDAYQDLCGRGSYCGKGIYSPVAFLAETEPYIPQGTVLSHDLLEGELAGCALASDIVLYDGHPSALSGWMKRLHRWTRGDWQLLPWLLSIPGRPGRDSLDAFSRQKIWDNLRRSLLPLCQCLLLLYGLLSSRLELFILALLFPSPPITLSRIVEMACLPYRLYIQTDAILRTLWRLCITREHLLDWVTSAQVELGKRTGLAPGILCQWLMGGLILLVSLISRPIAWHGVVMAGLFALFPFAINYLERPPYPAEHFSPEQEKRMRNLAQATWGFFEETVTEQDHFLPPDNRQADPDVGIAHRTSPTNLGFYLLSLVGAQALGFIGVDQMAGRMAQTLNTMERLSKWKGHFFNWYDTRTLSVLTPAYISSVDSGNLCACLLACAQALRELGPQLSDEMLTLPLRLDKFAYEMDLAALFDHEAQLFYIGYQVDEMRFTPAHYDLMASEARLVSYLAVMTQQVPLRHWFRLGRPLVKTSGGVSLLSWSGTLFEYWMPHILLPLIPGTLLHGICKNAARAQARHPLGGAWGISESGYYAFDPQLNYQYKAFGLSELALNSGSQDKVIAPYASALAASLMPRRTAENLIRMMNRGWACPTGLYEAADFNPSRIPKGEGHRLIRSQMAHHQGMVLCALTNALTNGFLTRCLMALPAAQAYRFLLEENMADRAPNRRIPQIKKRETLAQEEWQDAYQAEPFALPLAGQILSGGASTLFADALGNGFMCHEGLMLNRFSGEAGRKEGIQFYLREGSANRVFQPTDPLLPGSVTFSAGRAIYHRLVDELSVTLTCWVNPIDGAFLHLMEIENQQKTDRILEAASFFALTLLDKQADLAHPAFRELFVETAQLSPRTLIARRRPRQPSEPSPTLTHTLSCDGQVLHYAWQTDRCAFVGRNGSLFHPADMQRPIQAVSSMAGAPIHPCMSLRCQLMLPAKGRVQLLFATVLAEESLLTPAGVQERYDHPRKALTILKLAQTQSLSALRHAGLTPQEQGDAARLGACLLLRGMGVEHTSPASKEVLWRFGISGDLPLWFLHVAQARPSTLLNLCLSIHRLLRLQGVATHLMLLCSESHEDCFQMLEDLIPLPERQWIKWTSPEQADEDTVAALCAFSRLILWDNGGSLASQLEHIRQPLAPVQPPPVWEAAPPKLPAFAKEFDNGLGGFHLPEGDYVIDLPQGAATPAPWCNILSTPTFGTLVCESGPLFTYHGNSHHRRLTPWPNDPVSPQSGEGFLLYDLDSGCACSPTPKPLGDALNHRITYGPGTAEYLAFGFGLEQRLTLLTDPDYPLSIRRWKIKNTGSFSRKLRVSHYVRFILGVTEADAPCVALTPAAGTIYASAPGFEGMACLSLLHGEGEAVTLAPVQLDGLCGQPLEGLCQPVLRSSAGNVGVLNQTFELEPGESCQVVFLLGAPATMDDWEAQLSLLRAQGVSARIRLLHTYWASQLSPLQFHLPQEELQLMMNRWLPYQVRSARLNARAGFYQAGGAIGFRDQLQDMISLVHTHPERVRAHILDCAAHQFEEGDVQHWWHPPRHGVRTRISDDLLFLPYVTAWYIQATGDLSILEEPVPYLTAPSLSPGQEDRYDSPAVTDYTESLRGHCLRAMRHVEMGSHGIPLMKGGDWNDGMNRVGGEKGESIWLGFFYAATLKAFAPYAGEEEEALLRLAHQLLQSLDEHGWDGQWYLRAYDHSGEPLGSHRSSACQIDNLSQSWAVLAGMPKERASQGLESAYHRLFDADLGVMRLLDPPFSPPDKAGYIAGYLPGVRENGGQYTHAVPWVIWAMVELGWTERAWQLALALLPINHARTIEQAQRYRVEPYVTAGDIYMNPQQLGRGGWTFYTGSAAWLYTVVLEKLLGFERRGNRLRLKPKLPDHWNSFSITYQWGSSTYHLTASRDEEAVTLDGQPTADGWIILSDDGRIHQAQFRIL